MSQGTWDNCDITDRPTQTADFCRNYRYLKVTVL